MTTNEGQPSGQNPEWELNKEANIIIAKKLEGLLAKGPSVADTFQSILRSSIQYWEDEHDMDKITGLERQGLTMEVIPDYVKEELATRELTIGHVTALRHIENRNRRIFLGVGQSEEASRSDKGKAVMHGFIDLLPEGFIYPAYLIREVTHNEYDNPGVYVTTIDGKFPNEILGDDGLLYYLYNTFCFNLLGQGLKIEETVRGGTLDQEYDGEQLVLAKQKLKSVGFVPREEESRIMPLMQKDYRKVNGMFWQIDRGLFRFSV